MCKNKVCLYSANGVALVLKLAHNHPVLQDGYELVLKLKQRRWRCTNTPCSYTINESFNFVDKRKRNTNATDMLIIHAFRDLSVSASSIASKYKVSDTYVLATFDRYVKMDRLPLSDIISVDEVCLDLDPNCRYALVIQDFYTGNPIDLLSSRRTNDTGNRNHLKSMFFRVSCFRFLHLLAVAVAKDQYKK